MAGLKDGSFVMAGNDPASRRNTDASNQSGLAYQVSLTRQRDFIDSFIGKIEKALGIHGANEERSAHSVGAKGDGGRF